jgi:hypothetical protein
VEFDVGVALGLVCVLANERAETGRWSPVFSFQREGFSGLRREKGEGSLRFGREPRGRELCFFFFK